MYFVIYFNGELFEVEMELFKNNDTLNKVKFNSLSLICKIVVQIKVQ